MGGVQRKTSFKKLAYDVKRQDVKIPLLSRNCQTENGNENVSFIVQNGAQSLREMGQRERF